MKLKTLVIGGSGLFLMVFSLLLFVAILFSDEQDSGISNIHYGGVNVSAEVLAHKPMVEKYAKEYGVEEYVNILLAIIKAQCRFRIGYPVLQLWWWFLRVCG